MYNSKLLLLLKNLSAADLKQLYKFVQSPVHNTNKAALRLYEYIYKVAGNFDDSQKYLSKENAFEYLCPGEEYRAVYMRCTMTEVYNICEDFIAWKSLQENKMEKQLKLLAFYGERNLEKQFNTVLRKIEKEEAKKVRLADKHYYNKFSLEQELSLQIARQQDRTIEPNLQQISDNLDVFYFVQKLKVCCSIVHYQTMNNVEYKVALLDEVLAYLSKIDLSKHPNVEAYYHILNSLLDGENELHFENLCKVLFANLKVFSKVELREMFVFARNYCIKRINNGDESYWVKLLDLYKLELDEGLLLKNGVLSSFAYKNMVTIGIKTDNFDWLEEFVEKRTKHLEEGIREEQCNFNMARIYFAKKEFKKVIPLLQQTEQRELFNELNAKTILLKTYYELSELSALLSLMDSFRVFINRKKTLNYHQVNYKNFLKNLRQLIRLKMGSADKIEAFKKQIIEAKKLKDKDWFLEKIEEL